MRGAYGQRCLEWGQLTRLPGSLVRDSLGHPVFTGSPVVPASPGRDPVHGEVVRLVSETQVMVQWGEDKPMLMRAGDILVLPSLPSQRSAGSIVS